MRVETGTQDGLISHQCDDTIDNMKISAMDLALELRAGGEEISGLAVARQLLEIGDAANHDGERGGPRLQSIEMAFDRQQWLTAKPKACSLSKSKSSRSACRNEF